MRLFPLTLMLLVSGCATVSRDALCEGTRQAAANHAATLAASPDDPSVQTGQILLAQIDAGCVR